MVKFSAETIKAPFESKEAFLRFVRTDSPGGVVSTPWSNKDLEPTPPEHRHWRWFNLPFYWMTTAFGTAGWNLAASLIATGLTWRQSFAACALGVLISGIAVVLAARCAAVYHIGYPVIARSIFGLYGSFFFVFFRATIGTIWYGINTFYGANLMSTCLLCMFGHKWKNFPNHLPESASITSAQLLCFFLVWFIQAPFTLIHPRNAHWVFVVKGSVMPVAIFGLFGWCMANGAGISAIGNPLAKQADTPLGWAMLSGINSVIGISAGLLVSQPDMARYSVNPRAAGIPQGFFLAIPKLLVLFLGLASTASMQGKWGTAYWNIWDLNNAILEHNWTAAARTAVFLESLCFFFSTVGTNIGANLIPFSADVAGLLPRYITIVRGQVLCALIAVVILPWKLVASAQAFLTFLGAYNIFMGPILGLMAADYFIVRKGNIHIPSLYQPIKGTLYMFYHGFNLRSHLAWTGGMLLGLPGLIAAYQPNAVGESAKRMYTMAWILTTAMTVFLYLVLCYIFPVQTYPTAYSDVPVKWEYLGATEGYFDGEERRPTVFDELHGLPMQEENIEKEAITIDMEKIVGSKTEV
ncbi:uncharacterized protein PV07_07917 [Cladophialophora immunda]|uniref:NCS1 nucleoside transporter n=1 Tax=Cladophialophora immunda TaxID=569365 RepID=A0A0D2CAZ3_9EURO|nr:uncharacterized protein PV07_07917 [Cladophialophora immunda]KIW28238.1 hypothetical protein PV07_07917 [Cladophialophora immunda]OQV10811.1 hypothetical protein CLAIMM_14749 [Cladophialophora immunda]